MIDIVALRINYIKIVLVLLGEHFTQYISASISRESSLKCDNVTFEIKNTHFLLKFIIINFMSNKMFFPVFLLQPHMVWYDRWLLVANVKIQR